MLAFFYCVHYVKGRQYVCCNYVQNLCNKLLLGHQKTTNTFGMVFAVANQMLFKSILNFTNSKGNNMRHYSCNILYCKRLKKWFCCKDCKAHTASVLQDGCVIVSVQFLQFCHLVNIWLKQLLTYVNIS